MKNFNEGRGGFGGSKGGGFKKSGGSSFGNKPRFGADKKFGGGGFSGGRDRGDKGPELFPATCSQCGKDCKVPFRPSNDKPVFCNDCFGRKPGDDARGGGREERGQFLPRNEGRNDRRDERPVRRDADQGARNNGGNTDELKRTVANLEQKLNRVLDLLAAMAPQKSLKPSTPDSVVMVVKAEKKVIAPVEEKTPAAPAKKVAKKVAAPVAKVAKKAAKKAPAKVAKAPAKKVVKVAKKVATKKK